MQSHRLPRVPFWQSRISGLQRLPMKGPTKRPTNQERKISPKRKFWGGYPCGHLAEKFGQALQILEKEAFWHGHPARTSMKKLRSEKLRADFSFPNKGVREEPTKVSSRVVSFHMFSFEPIMISGPFNRLNVTLSLLHTLGRYRTPSAIGSATLVHIGRSSQWPRSRPLRKHNRAIVGLSCLKLYRIRKIRAPIKIKSALPPPPPKPKIPPPPKTRNFMEKMAFPAERTHFSRRP